MSLPRRAAQLPLTAISLGFTAWDRSRGLREFALRRGQEALQLAAVTPLGKLLPKELLDDGADEEAARIAADARAAAASDAADAARATLTERPTATPTRAAREVGAPGVVADKVQQVSEQIAIEVPEHENELPIPDFDNVSLGSLRARLRSLSVEQLVVLREWERAHANRLQVITTLDNRIAKLAG
jgi:hypothetical protein